MARILVKRGFMMVDGRARTKTLGSRPSTPAEDRRARTKVPVNLDGLHRLSSFHRQQVEDAKRVGCFYCLRFSSPKDVREWIDVRGDSSDKTKNRKGRTALCPLCGIDAVLPDRTFGFRVTAALLVAMKERWFGVRR